MRFLVDAQLPPALARWIGVQGHQAIHVLEIGLAGSDDSSIWDEAKRTNSVIISKDEDFVDRWLLRDEARGCAKAIVRTAR